MDVMGILVSFTKIPYFATFKKGQKGDGYAIQCFLGGHNKHANSESPTLFFKAYVLRCL